MQRLLCAGLCLVAVAVTALNGAAQAQQPAYPGPADLPNPYKLVEGWPTLPPDMNGGRWGEVITPDPAAVLRTLADRQRV